MCGIFGLLCKHVVPDSPFLQCVGKKIQHRGPDNTHTMAIDNVLLVFHRLAINGLDTSSDQPLTVDHIILCCNGEIYNYKELAEEHDIQLRTNSDCEIIAHLYIKYGIEKTCQLLDGEYSFMLYDTELHELFAARDLLGLRGFFYGTINDEIALASEAKALQICKHVEPFPPRSYWRSSTQEFKTYYEFVPKIVERTEEEICKLINKVFTDSVYKRVKMSERPCGFLLSGGLDSSLCTVLGAQCYDNPKDVHAFSIGLQGSCADLKYAKIVADYLGITHHIVEYTEEDFLKEIPETIRVIESYDVTTVRASNGHRLIAKYVKENTDIKVLISGEVSDELTCGYMAFGKIEDSSELLEESIRMLNEIHLYDTLRADRAICAYGLEGRYPFAAKEFLELYLSIPAELKTFFNKSRIEKYLLRKSFDGYLPNEIIYRRKDGFSDGISSLERSTSDVIKEYMDKIISDSEFERRRLRYVHLQPQTKEELYYRDIFEQYHLNRENLIPKFWKPNPKYYGDVVDPSGRILDTF